MKKSIQLFFLFLFPFTILGQTIYNGHVQDVSTQAALSGVNIQLLNSDIETRSNSYGDFIVKNTAQDTIIPSIYSYRFFNNSLIWEGDFKIGIEMFAIDGKQILREENIEGGTYLFPNLPFGVYLLRIKTTEGIQNFKAFSNGSLTMLADQKATWHRSSVPLQNDTLVVSKIGYYTRSIPLTGQDAFLKIR